ncbi:MAG TPA: XdhC family protein [Candidatus Melainabacteria bacterium]|nr:XdhC family protein [Candidatus Melainabacteria bacterium]
MSEIQEILSFYEQCLRQEKRCALATVIRTTGPSYRSPGSRSIVCEDGGFRGGLSAGCLEGDISCRLDGQKKSFLIEYDLTAEDDVRGFPFGCGGTVEILVEPLPSAQAMHAVEWFASLDQPAVLLTAISSDGSTDIGARYGMNASCDSTYHGKLKLPGMEALTLSVLSERKSRVAELESNGKSIKVFAEFYEPPISMYVFGDAEDARILEACASSHGFSVTRVSRNQVRSGESLAKMFPRLGHAYSVVMAHDLHVDSDIVHQLLQVNPPYLGIMGPRRRTERIFNSFERKWHAAIHRGNIFAPVGLDMGAETPREIALSILAEIQTVARNRVAKHLRDVDGAIHDRSLESRSVDERSLQRNAFLAGMISLG